MGPTRPLMYLSLPGLALVLGIIWFRRRKSVKCDDTGGRSRKCDPFQMQAKSISDGPGKPTESLNIDNKRRNEDGTENRFGKSAPIDIVTGKSSPIYLTDKQIDTEILKVKIHDCEYKNLRSIDEDFESLSSVDLPDSLEHRRRFSHPKRDKPIQHEKPVIIKASSPTKISPQHSFFEAAYTDDLQESSIVVENPLEGEVAGGGDANDSVTVAGQSSSFRPPSKLELTPETRAPPISSPPLSLCSVRSGDSGKGSSPPQSEGVPIVVYEFLLPSNLAGHLIGKKGAYVNQIKSKTGATVVLRRYSSTNKITICSVQGANADVSAALTLIRRRLPIAKYPHLTLQRVHCAVPQSIVPLSAMESACIQLELIEGINNDVIVSNVISGGHLFVQQPLHPSYQSLRNLTQCLNQIYSSGEAPLLPEIAMDAICVALSNDSWHRVQIVEYDSSSLNCKVKFVDYGGFVEIHVDYLRQIRADLMSIPFQATECVLSNLTPPDSKEYSLQSAVIVRALTAGIVLQAQIAGYTKENIPEIYLFASIAPDNVIFINRELVARNLAKWVENSELTA